MPFLTTCPVGPSKKYFFAGTYGNFMCRQKLKTFLGGVRLIIMRIRFRASDFGLVAKIKLSKIETGFSCGDDAQVILFLLV